jgi:hypothetical protein
MVFLPPPPKAKARQRLRPVQGDVRQRLQVEHIVEPQRTALKCAALMIRKMIAG